MRQICYYSSCILCFSIFTLNASSQKNEVTSGKGLKDYYKDYFTIGVAVSPSSVTGDQSGFILKNFGSLTCENVMKPAPIHPEENRYSWENADLIAGFARQNGLKMRGHTLVWHQQSPGWIFKDEQGNPASKDLVLKRLKEHISQVVGRYKGTVYAWDVVNEVINDDNSKVYRESEWFKTCGSDFIAAAFRFAHEADPDALLFYNDYNTENPVKREKIYNMIRGLLDEGVPIHGIGLQGHWSINNPSESQLRESLDIYSKLGIKIQVTELDVSVYPSDHKNPDDDLFTAEREQKQLDQYKMIFRVLRDYRNVINGVTFWNVSDRSSWLDNFPVRGRKNYPLLFDQNLQPKKVYWEVVNWK
jgi:endo-1,4-beta-xylanase